MHRYFIELSYKGTNYHGWQIQPNSITVQGIMNNVISKKIGEPIITIGAGRTDTGVHASNFFAHFDAEQEGLDKNAELIHQINSFLPQDIMVKKIYLVGECAHARFDASSREYQYYITRQKDALYYDYSTPIYHELDVTLMNEGAKVIMQHNDFSSFSKSNTDVKTNICKISKAIWEERDNQKLVFTIEADRFLRNMVRAIVGTLIDVGKKKTAISELEKIIESKDRRNAGESAPAKGLFLTNIKYPEQILKLTVQ